MLMQELRKYFKEMIQLYTLKIYNYGRPFMLNITIIKPSLRMLVILNIFVKYIFSIYTYSLIKNQN